MAISFCSEAIFAIIESLGAKSVLLRHEVCYNPFDLFVFIFIQPISSAALDVNIGSLFLQVAYVLGQL